MIRNCKILGLVLGAAMALSAVMASAALAVPQYTSSSYPFTVTGLNAKGSESFSTEAGKIECDSHYVSHSLSAAGSTLTVTPAYTNCSAFGFAPTLNNEGCGYVFHATERVGAGVYRHHVSVSCGAGKSMKWTAGTCKFEIKPQTGLTTAESTNLAAGTVTVQLNVQKIAYTVTQDGFGCPFTGTGNKTDGSFTGHIVLAKVGGGSVSVSGE